MESQTSGLGWKRHHNVFAAFFLAAGLFTVYRVLPPGPWTSTNHRYADSHDDPYGEEPDERFREAGRLASTPVRAWTENDWIEWDRIRTDMLSYKSDKDDRKEYPRTAKEFSQQATVSQRYNSVSRLALSRDELRQLNEDLLRKFPEIDLSSRLAYEGYVDDVGRTPYDVLLLNQSNDRRHHWGRGNHEYRGTGMMEDDFHLYQSALEELHRNRVEAFAVWDNFGYMRIFGQPDPKWLYATMIAPQCDTLPKSAEIFRDRRLGGKDKIFDFETDPISVLHRAMVDQFTARTGYIFDFRKARDFQPHAVRSSIEWNHDKYFSHRTPPLQIRRFELVGLMKSEVPQVYESDGLPNMNMLSDVTTRPLDAFEAAALRRLYEGERVVLAADSDRLRMMGSIQAETSCTQCHNVRPGHLLGAFSYAFEAVIDPAKAVVDQSLIGRVIEVNQNHGS